MISVHRIWTEGQGIHERKEKNTYNNMKEITVASHMFHGIIVDSNYSSLTI